MLVLLALFGIHIKMAATMDVSPTNATTTEIIADDDDAWLYGDEGKGNKENVQSDKIEKSDLRETNKTELNGITIKKEDREEGEMSGEEGDSQEKDEDSDDDDDDDDNVQVTIGDIKAWSASEQPRNLFKSGTNYQKTAAGGAPKTTVTTKGLDLEAQGTINGIPVFEFDLSTINNEDKPWRKPGADITDYFNYGFNEDTWQLYCEKQRRLIAMNEGTAPVPKIVTHHTTSASSRAEKESSAGSRRNVTSTTKPVGQIDVIGATAKDSRRPESEGDPIPVAGAAHLSVFSTPRKFIPPPGMPPTTLPPPHMPPVDYSIPPPGLPMPHGVPPPGMPGMTVPPPGFPPVPDPYDPFFSVPPPDRSVPPPGFDERQAYGFNAPPQAFSNNAFADASRQGSSHQWETGGSYGERDWERDRERRGDGNRRDRSPHRSEEDFARNEEELHMLQMESLWRDRDRDHDRSRDRERSRERERERERGDRDRSDRRRERDILRSRSHDRDKERERERELERLSRVEEVKHRSRRSSSIRSDSVRSESRKHRDDSDTESVRSSKHKSRRRKREKDDEASESAVEREATKGE